jgi:hypothetical protein
MLNIVKANGMRVNAPVRKRYNWVINRQKNTWKMDTHYGQKLSYRCTQ